MTPVISLEFNELTPSLIERFIAEGQLPNFKRLRDESRTFITEASEREPYLEPWIQWVTVHTGVDYKTHGIFNLDEGDKLQLPRVWDLLAERGHSSFICGSMNTAARTARTALVPDPWSSKVPATPPELNTYFSFVRRQVLEHTNEDTPLGARDIAAFLGFMVTHGLSSDSCIAIARQLLEERRHDCRWRRVVLLDLLQFDVFEHYYKKLRPNFSTFFLNSTAHYQHAYWEHMEPEAFGKQALTPPDMHADAILYGYQRMDRIIGRMFRRFPDATLVLSTALSQEAWADHDEAGGGTFFRPKDLVKFVRLAGVTADFTVAPVMSEQFHVDFVDAAAADAAERVFAASRAGSSRLMYMTREGRRLFLGCAIKHDVAEDAMITVGDHKARFHDVFYIVPTSKTAKHHPDGVFWVRLPDRVYVDGGRTPLASVAPTLLSLFDVRVPRHMEAPPVALGLPMATARAVA